MRNLSVEDILSLVPELGISQSPTRAPLKQVGTLAALVPCSALESPALFKLAGASEAPFSQQCNCSADLISSPRALSYKAHRIGQLHSVAN